MIVKAVVPVDKRKCKVFLEGDFAFVLYKSEAARFHIEEGNDLPAKTYEMIEEEILLKRARDRALYLLQSQGRTQAEMIKKLKDDGYSQSVTERVLSFLQEYHFIDDNAYTENYIHVNKGRKSKRQITYELQQKGVDRDQIRQMLEENPVDEEETVRALLKKKTGGRIPEDKKEIQKLAAFLGRKGFSFEVNQSSFEGCGRLLKKTRLSFVYVVGTTGK